MTVRIEEQRVRSLLRGLVTGALAAESIALVGLGLLAIVGSQLPLGPGAWSMSAGQTVQLSSDQHRLRESALLAVLAAALVGVSLIRTRWIGGPASLLCIGAALAAAVLVIRHSHGSAGLTLAVGLGSLITLVHPVHRILVPAGGSDRPPAASAVGGTTPR